MMKLLNGFNNGRDKSDGIGGKPQDFAGKEILTDKSSGLNKHFVINWVAEKNAMPDYDGDYLCFIHAKQECGNVWEIQKVVRCEFNKWVLDCGEQVKAWAELPKPPCL